MIDGPRLPPANGEPAKHLVVFLHGYGADGNDLIDIGRYWAEQLPDTAFVSPHAPEPCGQAPMGRQWFDLPAIDLDVIDRGARAAAGTIQGFLDAELERHGFDESRLALVGFSQGAMMALEVGLRRPHPVAGIVGYSGMIAGPDRLAGEITVRPPVLMVHGEADPLVPVMALHASVPVLGAVDVPVEWHIRPGLEHGIDPEGLELGARFLKQAFA